MKLNTFRMEFSGKLLKRGFWLYVWDIKEESRRHLYVGRTGDSSSPNASSPFRRIGQHLDTRLNARGNALGRRLKEANIDPETCTFEMIAIGPLFEEQSSRSEHDSLRDKTAALERALADELKRRGYSVLGDHPRQRSPEPALLDQVMYEIRNAFPDQSEPAAAAVPRFQPIKLRGEGPSASQMIMNDRGRR